MCVWEGFHDTHTHTHMDANTVGACICICAPSLPKHTILA